MYGKLALVGDKVMSNLAVVGLSTRLLITVRFAGTAPEPATVRVSLNRPLEVVKSICCEQTHTTQHTFE